MSEFRVVRPHDLTVGASYRNQGLAIPATIQDLIDSLTWYVTDETTVSVLHSVWGWEAWAWPTRTGSHDARTAKPTVYDTEAEALAYRDEVLAA